MPQKIKKLPKIPSHTWNWAFAYYLGAALMWPHLSKAKWYFTGLEKSYMKMHHFLWCICQKIQVSGKWSISSFKYSSFEIVKQSKTYHLIAILYDLDRVQAKGQSSFYIIIFYKIHYFVLVLILRSVQKCSLNPAFVLTAFVSINYSEKFFCITSYSIFHFVRKLRSKHLYKSFLFLYWSLHGSTFCFNTFT